MLRSTYRPIINSDRARRRDNGWLREEGNERTFYRGGGGAPRFSRLFREAKKKMSKSRGAVRIRSEWRTKRHSVIKLSRRSVDIINLLRARSSRANHRRAFNLGIHKYHDAERRREFSRKQEAIAPPSPLPSFSPPLFPTLFPISSPLFLSNTRFSKSACSKIGVRWHPPRFDVRCKYLPVRADRIDKFLDSSSIIRIEHKES